MPKRTRNQRKAQKLRLANEQIVIPRVMTRLTATASMEAHCRKYGTGSRVAVETDVAQRFSQKAGSSVRRKKGV